MKKKRQKHTRSKHTKTIKNGSSLELDGSVYIVEKIDGSVIKTKIDPKLVLRVLVTTIEQAVGCYSQGDEV